MELILEQYEIKFKNTAQDCLIAELFHWKKNNFGGTNITPIGHMIITNEPYSEPFLPHRAIQLFLRTDVKYSINTKETIVVSNPKGQAGSNKSLFHKLTNIKESNLPNYHPELPTSIINHLIQFGICKEPIGMNICHFDYVGYKERGQLWENEDGEE